MHFETIANNQSCNTALRARRRHIRWTPHLPNYWKPTTKETNPGLQTPPRNSPHERSILSPRLPAHRVIQKCPMVNADSLENTIAVNTNTTKNPRREMGGVVTQGFA
jgi:hypothetical protein